MSIAKIENGIVTQVDRTRNVPLAGWVECFSDTAPGTLYDGRNFKAPDPDPRAAILAQIASLEATVTPRRAREAILSDEGRAWLVDIDARIATLRVLL